MYVLHPAAESDLRDVVRYSLRQWGEAQTRRYMDELSRDIEALAAGEKPSKEAVFHERMDLMTRLARRLPK